MATLDLALLKKQVRADDFSDDDAYLQHLLDTAKETILSYSSRTLAEITALGLENSYNQAVLMLAGHWYNAREAVSSVAMSSVPWTVEALLKRFQKLAEDTTTTTSE